MKRMHDADLCERIRELEKEVERLKANQCHGHWHWYPQWTWTAPQPYIYYGTSTTTGSATIGSINTLALGSTEWTANK